MIDASLSLLFFLTPRSAYGYTACGAQSQNLKAAAITPHLSDFVKKGGARHGRLSELKRSAGADSLSSEQLLNTETVTKEGTADAAASAVPARGKGISRPSASVVIYRSCRRPRFSCTKQTILYACVPGLPRTVPFLRPPQSAENSVYI